MDFPLILLKGLTGFAPGKPQKAVKEKSAKKARPTKNSAKQATPKKRGPGSCEPPPGERPRFPAARRKERGTREFPGEVGKTMQKDFRLGFPGCWSDGKKKTQPTSPQGTGELALLGT